MDKIIDPYNLYNNYYINIISMCEPYNKDLQLHTILKNRLDTGWKQFYDSQSKKIFELLNSKCWSFTIHDKYKAKCIITKDDIKKHNIEESFLKIILDNNGYNIDEFTNDSNSVNVYYLS